MQADQADLVEQEQVTKNFFDSITTAIFLTSLYSEDPSESKYKIDINKPTINRAFRNTNNTRIMTCKNGIREQYLRSNLNRSLKVDKHKNHNNYDIAALYNIKDKQYVGFIIVEKGECKDYPTVWSVNLICSSENGGGAILMGLYLFTIASNENITPKVAILELANSYINFTGLASYSKLGFTPNYNLYGPNCFSEHNNLPMSMGEKVGNIEFGNPINKFQIINILKGFKDEECSRDELCNYRDNEQLYYGLRMNVALLIIHGKHISENYHLADDRIIHYDDFKKKLEKLGRDTTELDITKMRDHAKPDIESGILDNIIEHPPEIEEERPRLRSRRNGGRKRKTKRRKYIKFR